jgi:Family of unknown function (DUF6493)
MTISQLDEIILAADTEKCAVFFETMTEPQRKALSQRALQWASAINGYCYRARPRHHLFDDAVVKDVDFYESIQSHAVTFPTDFTDASYPVARMAVLATCGFPELKKADTRGLPQPKLAARLLQARKPTWLNKWCAYVLKEFPATYWLALYELEKSGTYANERTAKYWVAMVCGLPNIEGMYQDILALDEKIRTELWDMLADPGVMRTLAEPEQIGHENIGKRWRSGGDIFARNQTGNRKGSDLWREALVKLASEGLIDQKRLVEYSFMALSRTAENQAKKSYYQHVSTADFAIKLNQDLTKENVVSYASQFTSLLGATHQDISTYASTVLAAMPKGELSVGEICSCIQPAFLNRNKEPAESALKLLNRLAKEHPLERAEYGPAILSAFNHSSKDIHRKALALIESTKMLEDQNLLSEFRQRMDMLAGMERTNAAKMAAHYQGASGTACDAVPGGAPPSDTTSAHTESASTENTNAEELFARSSVLDPTLRALARIDDAIEATKKKTRLDAPVSLDAMEFPRLDPDRPLKPIANFDDLVYMFTKVWSGKSDAMDVEALFDGVSRLCHERPPDFEQKTDVLRQKAQKSAQEDPSYPSRAGLAHIAFAWLCEPSDHSGIASNPPRLTFFGRRCLAVAQRAASRRSAPLLAAPTHAGGWIDPQILVKRLLEYSRMNIEPDKVDFIQALLRMAPDNRAAALEAATSIKGEMGQALRYALGGGKIADVQTPEYWVAAFRARDPKGTSSELLKLLPNFGPDAAEPAIYHLNVEAITHFASDRYSSMSGGLPDFLSVKNDEPAPPAKEQSKNIIQTALDQLLRSANRGNNYDLFPTVLLHDNSNSWFAGPDTYNWLHNRESLLSLYAKRMLINIHSIGNYWHSNYDILFDPDISMAGIGRYVLCFAMSSKNNDVARLAVDALIAAVAECRIGGSAFGEAMATVLPPGVITPVRWVRGLRAMVRTSPMHAHFTWQAVCTLIEQAPITPTQQIPFLELLAELQVEHRFKHEGSLLQALSRNTGAGKSAKLIKTILAFKGDDNSAVLAALQDLESRINRAERWQNWIRAGRKEAVV